MALSSHIWLSENIYSFDTARTQRDACLLYLGGLAMHVSKRLQYRKIYA